MAMIRLGRIFAKSPSSSGAQFHSQANSSHLSNRHHVFTTTPKEAVSVLLGCGLIHISSGWVSVNGRSIYEEWKSKIKMQKILEELDRKKEFPEAYLEMIHREIEILKPRLFESEEFAEWELNKYEREIAFLRSKLYEWTQGKDFPASNPQK